MDKDTIRLGVIGIGISNMASTLVLLKDEPDLRYQPPFPRHPVRPNGCFTSLPQKANS